MWNVNGDLQTRVVLVIQISGGGPLGLVGAIAGNFDVETIGVMLGEAASGGHVKADALMPHHILPPLDRPRDGDGPGVIVVLQLVGGPVALSGRKGAGIVLGTEQAGFLDLKPHELGLIHGGAIAVAISHIGQDRAMVTAVKGRFPHEGDVVARCEGGAHLAGKGVDVADDVGALILGA